MQKLPTLWRGSLAPHDSSQGRSNEDTVPLSGRMRAQFPCRAARPKQITPRTSRALKLVEG
jgi:hypothetical protein